MKADIAYIRYGARESEVMRLERKMEHTVEFRFADYGSHMGHTFGLLDLESTYNKTPASLMGVGA